MQLVFCLWILFVLSISQCYTLQVWMLGEERHLRYKKEMSYSLSLIPKLFMSDGEANLFSRSFHIRYRLLLPLPTSRPHSLSLSEVLCILSQYNFATGKFEKKKLNIGKHLLELVILLSANNSKMMRRLSLMQTRKFIQFAQLSRLIF